MIRSAATRDTLNRFYEALKGLEDRIGVDDPSFQQLNRIRVQMMRDACEL